MKFAKKRTAFMSSLPTFIRPFAFNAFCCWAVALASLITAVSIFKKRKGDKEAISFGFVWLLVGLSFVAIGSYTLILPKINKPIIYAGQMFIGMIFVALGYYSSYRIWRSPKISKITSVFYSLFFAAWAVLVFSAKFPAPVISDWGVAFKTPLVAFIFFEIVFILPLGISFFYLFFRQIFRWLKTKKIDHAFRFFAVFSVALLFFAGYFDERGLNAGWQLLFFRELELLAVLIAYLCYAERAEEKDKTIN